ncbi:hypothetical protein PI126_g3713 [Phytophthora idaei]|nr:hypothetical protein PI126_g3713 [Phytophthora idaei]
MHCDVEDQRLKQRLLNKKPERGENFVNFAVGDYVLRSRFDKRQGNKLQATWVGPYRVVRPDTHSFTVERLVTGELTDGHASRLKMYAGDSLEVTEELLEYVSSQGIVLAVNELKDHRWNTSIEDYEPLVSWKGLQSIEDSYEPVKNSPRRFGSSSTTTSPRPMTPTLTSTGSSCKECLWRRPPCRCLCPLSLRVFLDHARQRIPWSLRLAANDAAKLCEEPTVVTPGEAPRTITLYQQGSLPLLGLSPRDVPRVRTASSAQAPRVTSLSSL